MSLLSILLSSWTLDGSIVGGSGVLFSWGIETVSIRLLEQLQDSFLSFDDPREISADRRVLIFAEVDQLLDSILDFGLTRLFPILILPV
jgi:hypothetical protein